MYRWPVDNANVIFSVALGAKLTPLTESKTSQKNLIMNNAFIANRTWQI